MTRGFVSLLKTISALPPNVGITSFWPPLLLRNFKIFLICMDLLTFWYVGFGDDGLFLLMLVLVRWCLVRR